MNCDTFDENLLVQQYLTLDKTVVKTFIFKSKTKRNGNDTDFF